MNNYLIRLTATPTGFPLSFDIQKPNPGGATSFGWSYRFRDGSRLVGQVNGQLDEDGNLLLNPTEIKADYIGADGKTALVSWNGSDFACFETTVDGTNALIVASNDNFVGNSMCLVSLAFRPRAQVTEQETQVIGEPFELAAWSVIPCPSPVGRRQSSVGWDLSFSPLFPFLSVSCNFWLLNPRTIYRWTAFPCLPFWPFVQVVKAAPS